MTRPRHRADFSYVILKLIPIGRLVFPSAASGTMSARSERRIASTQLRLTLSSQSLSSTLNSALGAVRIHSLSIYFSVCHSYSLLFTAHYTRTRIPSRSGRKNAPAASP